MPASSPNRSYAAAHFALELDGKEGIGLFRSIEGGGVRTDVLTYEVNGGPRYDRWRQLGKPKYEDFKLQVGMAMSKPFYDWIADFFEGNQVRKTGAVVAADFYYVERARRHFTAAMINEITFPKLDGADKGPAYMSVGISVENIEFHRGSGRKLAPPTGFDTQKLWTACNFRWSLSGFEEACRRVSKIEPFTVKQQVLEYHMGGQLSPTKTPSAIEFPNITFYVPEADAQPFFHHYSNRNQLAIKSSGQAPSQLHGTLTTFDNQGGDLFTLTFSGADIVGVTPDRSDSSSEEIKQVKVEIYTERMHFHYVPITLV
jgi:hypothetical protein